jgi:hypothetical protein
MASLLERFPRFANRWEKYVEFWGGQAQGSYMDMAEFVHFVVENLYEKGNLDQSEPFKMSSRGVRRQ